MGKGLIVSETVHDHHGGDAVDGEKRDFTVKKETSYSLRRALLPPLEQPLLAGR